MYMTVKNYSAVIAVSVAVGFWLGRAFSISNPKMAAELSAEDLNDDCKLVYEVEIGR